MIYDFILQAIHDPFYTFLLGFNLGVCLYHFYEDIKRWRHGRRN